MSSYLMELSLEKDTDNSCGRHIRNQKAHTQNSAHQKRNVTLARNNKQKVELFAESFAELLQGNIVNEKVHLEYTENHDFKKFSSQRWRKWKIKSEQIWIRKKQ